MPSFFIVATAACFLALHFVHSHRNCFSSIGLGCLPLYLPSAFIIAITLRYRSRIISRYNYAKTANTVNMNPSCEVVVSSCSFKLMISTPLAHSLSTSQSISELLRASLEYSLTITTSPSRTYSSIRFSSGRLAVFSLHLSINIL